MEGKHGPVHTRGGDGEREDSTAVEEARKDIGERTGDLREGRSKVESTSGRPAGWGKSETNGERGLSGDTREVHVVGTPSETVENSGNEVLEESTEFAGSFVAQAEGGVDVERTTTDSTGVEATSDSPNGVIERTTAFSLIGFEILPLGCRLKISGSIVKLD